MEHDGPSFGTTRIFYEVVDWIHQIFRGRSQTKSSAMSKHSRKLFPIILKVIEDEGQVLRHQEFL
jgi:hypothetical protein